MNSKKQVSDRVACRAASEWLREVAVEHLQSRGFSALQCGRKVLGVNISIEIFFDSAGVQIVFFWGSQSPQPGVQSDFEFDSLQDKPSQISDSEWLAEVIAATFLSNMVALSKSGPFVAERDRIFIEEATGSVVEVGGAKRL